MPTVFYSRDSFGRVSFASSLYQTNFFPRMEMAPIAPLFNANYLLPTDSGNWDCVVFDAWGRSMTSSVLRRHHQRAGRAG